MLADICSVGVGKSRAYQHFHDHPRSPGCRPGGSGSLWNAGGDGRETGAGGWLLRRWHRLRILSSIDHLTFNEERQAWNTLAEAAGSRS